MKCLTCILSVILLILFGGIIFSRNKTMFFNDASYGVQMSEQCNVPEMFIGVWADNNWLGDQSPSLGASVSYGIRYVSWYWFIGVPALLGVIYVFNKYPKVGGWICISYAVSGALGLVMFGPSIIFMKVSGLMFVIALLMLTPHPKRM